MHLSVHKQEPCECRDCLAKIDGLPETRENVEILLSTIDLHLIPQEGQLVCDLKLTGLINGIHSCTSLYSCPFYEGCKYNAQGKRTNKRGRHKWRICGNSPQ